MIRNSFILLLVLTLMTSCATDESDSQANTHLPNDYPWKQSVGYSANAILAENDFQVIDIDLMYIQGFKPEQNTINNVIDFIKKRTYKTTIKITPRVIGNTNTNTYSINDIKALEDSNRVLFTKGNTIALSALFVNGASSSNNGNNMVLGTAYRNTSFVIFQETIQELSDAPLETNRVTLETSVILHELCHLLGLVNIGADMVENHQDPNHGAHCNVDSCLMYYALENGNTISNTLSGNQIPQLDAFCLQDLQAHGGK